jgi:hypothetical protein
VEILETREVSVQSESYFGKIRLINIRKIASQSLPSEVAHLLLFAATLAATSIFRREPTVAGWFGASGLLITLLRSLVATRYRKEKAESGNWARLFRMGFYIAALHWGMFAAWTMQTFALSWDSLFVMLMTAGISAGTAPLLIPDLRMKNIYLLALLGPISIACLLRGGLQDFALGGFFAMYAALLGIQGKMQYDEYLYNCRSEARFKAMLDAMPGTLSWIGSDLLYRGVNLRLAGLFGMDPDEFVGKKVGFTGASTPIMDFTKTLLTSDKIRDSQLIDVNMGDKVRKYCITGQKYDNGQEMVIVGTDVTDF